MNEAKENREGVIRSGSNAQNCEWPIRVRDLWVCTNRYLMSSFNYHAFDSSLYYNALL